MESSFPWSRPKTQRNVTFLTGSFNLPNFPNSKIEGLIPLGLGCYDETLCTRLVLLGQEAWRLTTEISQGVCNWWNTPPRWSKWPQRVSQTPPEAWGDLGRFRHRPAQDSLSTTSAPPGLGPTLSQNTKIAWEMYTSQVNLLPQTESNVTQPKSSKSLDEFPNFIRISETSKLILPVTAFPVLRSSCTED